jgi:hypothetical protein
MWDLTTPHHRKRSKLATKRYTGLGLRLDDNIKLDVYIGCELYSLGSVCTVL